MAALKDRLYRALGYPTASSMAAPAITQDNLRRTSTPNIYTQPQVSCEDLIFILKLVR